MIPLNQAVIGLYSTHNMKLKKPQLVSFRNFEELSLDISQNINIFLGKNGTGKTSILEAISMLSMPKSFRTSSINDLIMFDWDYFRVVGVFEDESGEDKTLEIGYQIEPRKYRSLKINQVKKSTKEFLKGVYVATFVPQDLYLIDLGPSKRREYINRVLCKLDFMYLDYLSRYEKVMKERNAVLRRINEGLSSRDELPSWDEQLIASGSALIKRRLELLKEMAPELKKKYSLIAGSDEKPSKDKVEVGYASKMHEVVGYEPVLRAPFEEEMSDGKISLERITELFEKALAARIDRDVITRTTSVGPHRDDLHFYLNDKNMEHFASRGEKRTLLLSLKVTELEVVKAHVHSTPILLLDDVFSELDNDRQTQLLHLISPYQTFITTNSPEHFENFEDEKAVWKVEKGRDGCVNLIFVV